MAREMTDPVARSCLRCGASFAPGVTACLACDGRRPSPLTTPQPIFDLPAMPFGIPMPSAAPAPAITDVTDATDDDDDDDGPRGPSTSPEADTKRKLSNDPDAKDTNGERPEDQRFKSGDVILGHYVVVKQLGRGGMGTVYLARDDVSGQEVAVKVLPAQLARERDIRERFVQEARALASLDHPNIVPLVTFSTTANDAGEDRFLVMKYVAGEALDARIRRTGVMSPAHARKVLRAMLSALGYAHQRGVIHRDIKPSNVLIEGDLDGEHRVFLVDFGIAKKEEGGKRLTQTGMLMGTPQYMSPEQISGHPVDGRSDLYAAGLVLFEMLAGRPPFDGQKTFQVLRAHVEEPVPDVRAVRGHVTRDNDLPEDVIALTYLLLRKSPDDRPRDATEAIGLLDGTGSFPPLRPEELARLPLSEVAPQQTSTPPAVTPPTTSVPAPQVRAAARQPIDDGALLDDPSVAEIAAVRPRRGPRFMAALFVLALVGVGVFGMLPRNPLQPTDTLAADAGVLATTVTDDAAYSMLIANARMQLEKNEIDRARIAIDAALDRAPDDVKALSLRVDILIAGKAIDDAERTLARLKELLVRKPETDETLRKHVDDQEKAIIDHRSAREAEDAAKRERATERAPSRSKRPSELSKKAFSDVTSATRGGISNCYAELVQAKNPKANGEITLTVRVKPSGDVDNVDIRRPPKAFRGADFQKCLQREVRKWKFRPFTGGPDSFVHQFLFSPSG